MKKYIILSIKPVYTAKLLAGSKTIELRKSRPNIGHGDIAIFYSTSPVKSVVGYGVVSTVIEDAPHRLWLNYKEKLGIDKEGFVKYFEGREKAVGIMFEKVVSVNPISLDLLRIIIAGFQPPQFFRYLSKNVIDDLHLLGNIDNRD